MAECDINNEPPCAQSSVDTDDMRLPGVLSLIFND